MPRKRRYSTEQIIKELKMLCDYVPGIKQTTSLSRDYEQG